MKRVSLKDIAAEAHVSVSVVSFVLNGKYKQHRISESMAEKIMKIASDMGYTPNIAAKSLRDGKSRAIGVVVSDISNPFFSAIARYVETAAERLGYTVQFSSSDESGERMESLVNSMICRNLDGIIIVPCEFSENFISGLVSKNIPIVLLDRKFDAIGTSSVCLDNFNASVSAVRHLVEQGFRKIGAIAYDLRLSHMDGRIRGYMAAMEEAGMGKDAVIRYVTHGNMRKSCRKAITSVIESGCDAVLLASNSIAIESLSYIMERGLKVPEDIGIVSFDGGTAFDFYASPITYIRQPLELMAEKATEVLIEQIESHCSIIQRIEVSGELVVRASSIKK